MRNHLFMLTLALLMLSVATPSQAAPQRVMISNIINRVSIISDHRPGILKRGDRVTLQFETEFGHVGGLPTNPYRSNMEIVIPAQFFEGTEVVYYNTSEEPAFRYVDDDPKLGIPVYKWSSPTEWFWRGGTWTIQVETVVRSSVPLHRFYSTRLRQYGGFMVSIGPPSTLRTRAVE